MKRLVICIASLLLIAAAGTITLIAIRYFDDSTKNVPSDSETKSPELTSTTLLDDLDHPWDIDFLPDATLVFTERSGDISKLKDGKKTVLESPTDIETGGEGGLMGLAVDPDFATNRFIYACLNTTKGDVRVARWVVDAQTESLSARSDIVTGIPAANSGRHSGCQIAFGPDDNLWIGTGDAADESEPQNLSSLGGKILRVDRDGKAAEDNANGTDKRIYSYGHRNTQALAFYESKTGESYGVSVEHGSDKDDEVNQLSPGNFGWAPGSGYDESVPMTDTRKFPNAIESVWSSGSTTIAPSGAAFLSGSAWGRLNGWLAVSVLKDQKLMLLNIDDGSVNGTRDYFTSEHGRLRAATLGPDGALYVSTDNGVNDSILRVAPIQN